MKKILGIELGSTRIKSVLIDENGVVLGQGSHEWENQLENGYWTYSLDAVWNELQDSYASLVKNYGEITSLDGIGISAMMHGYLAFDKDDNLLVPFRTWRNTTTEQAADILTKELDFNMPQRWSTSHYYQAILNNEEHVSKIASL
ncbi:MAG: ATPase, partial [Clostridia bacterium]|nr:ATPase [Clostridia bacterium]